MAGIDERIAELGGGGLLVTLAVALLLGLRHATDPDHLTAVCTLALDDERRGASRAGLLGFAWGLGHATTLLIFGVPIVAFGTGLPDAVTQAAEVGVGLLIIGIAIRLLLRWRRGTVHVHPHSHGALRHAHPHVHERAHDHDGSARSHEHPHVDGLGRSPLAAFGVGLVHGVGGSAGVSIVVVAGASTGGAAAAALLVLAAGAMASMAAVSAAVGWSVGAPGQRRRIERLIPVYGTAGLAFGAWYLLAAVGA